MPSRSALFRRSCPAVCGGNSVFLSGSGVYVRREFSRAQPLWHAGNADDKMSLIAPCMAPRLHWLGDRPMVLRLQQKAHVAPVGRLTELPHADVGMYVSFYLFGLLWCLFCLPSFVPRVLCGVSLSLSLSLCDVCVCGPLPRANNRQSSSAIRVCALPYPPGLEYSGVLASVWSARVHAAT